MSELSKATTLAEDARRLAALARAKRESETDSQEQRRLQTQLEKLRDELGRLRRELELRQALRDVGAPVDSLPELTAEPREVREQVNRTGRPTWRYIQARVKRLEGVNRDLSAVSTRAWSEWTQEQMSKLPLGFLPRLGLNRRQTKADVDTLRNLASKAPDPAAIRRFQLGWNRVGEELSRVESAGVDAVLDRFVGRQIRLSDLSDKELDLLRSDQALRSQLYLTLLS